MDKFCVRGCFWVYPDMMYFKILDCGVLGHRVPCEKFRMLIFQTCSLRMSIEFFFKVLRGTAGERAFQNMVYYSKRGGKS
jgi:hypothetical protein